MRSVELFSGCGGLALGLSRAGFDHEFMAEWDADAVETVKHNKLLGVEHVAHWPIHQMDVRTIDWTRFTSPLSLLAGGPPCQPFSVGGKHQGADDSRDMWPQAIKAVKVARPKFFLFENVRGLTREAFADYLDFITLSLTRPTITSRADETRESHLKRLRESKKSAEYLVVMHKVNAADFGAPQKRHRVIIAGVRSDLGGALPALRATHSRERLLWDMWVTGSYWRRHRMIRPDDLNIPRADLPLVKKLRAADIAPESLPWVTVRDAMRGLGKPNGRRNHAYQAGARAYPGHTGCVLDAPAKALKAGDHGVPGGENMLVGDDGSVRYFTIREAARLQGLPDDYAFPRSWTESMRQIGNAVPTQLGEAAGLWIRETLEQLEADERLAA